MNRKSLLCCILCLVMGKAVTLAQPIQPSHRPYLFQQPQIPIDQRVSDLLSRMTLEEKVGQLCCTMGWNYYEIKEKKRKRGREVVPSASFKKDIREGKIGMLWATFRADPWTQKSLANGLTTALAAEAANALQRYVRDSTRLGIPLFLAEEAPHGHMAIGTTVFPTGLGMAATWSPELMQQMGEVIAREIRLQGGHISYGPVLDLARDPRWSRVEETLGEDPVLTGTLGAAMVRGLGGGNLSKPYSTLATLKHFIAYGCSEGGQNGAQTVLGERELHENFLPPFREAIEAGALSVMTSYNSVDGIPCTANGHLLTDVLRRQWQFRGFVVSDLYSIDGLAGTHRVAANRQEAAIQALQAGVDVDLGANSYPQLGISSPALDSAVARILRLKFEMGLFDNPFVDPKAAAPGVRTPEHKAVALAAARASVTLLKNSPSPEPSPVLEGSSVSSSRAREGGEAVLEGRGFPLSNRGGGGSGVLLPLPRTVRLLVCGPNADNRYNQLGDYTAPQEDGNVKTILDGIRAKLPAAQVQYVKGCAIRDTTTADIPAAVQAAQTADVIVCCVGGSSARDFKTSYQETGAATISDPSVTPSIPDMESGEGYDRATLALLGRQQQLLEALKATGKPLVVIYIEGRPLDKTWAAEHADALLTAYYPGQEGGTAIADVLFGDYNPAGRLPVSVPHHVGQLPVYYNKKVPHPHDYVELPATPLFPFGFGLSYTTFAYSNLQIRPVPEGPFSATVPEGAFSATVPEGAFSATVPEEPFSATVPEGPFSATVPGGSPEGKMTSPFISVTCDITNTGSRDGEEVAQLYLRDELASTVQPPLQLKAFQRIFIPRGETRQVTFTLSPNDFAIIDLHLRRTIEPGTFTILVGSSSVELPLQATLTLP